MAMALEWELEWGWEMVKESVSVLAMEWAREDSTERDLGSLMGMEKEVETEKETAKRIRMEREKGKKMKKGMVMVIRKGTV
jgi:hypothetical protein